MKNVDLAIIGAGIAGIFAAYKVVSERPDLKVVVVEQGLDIRQRSCPIITGKVSSCVHCKICAIMRGFGGAGAFSDGKFNFTTEFGGWLTDYLSDQEVMELISEVDKINVTFGASKDVHSTFTPEAELIRKKALGLDIHLLNARCKHLGTDRNREVLIHQYDYLNERAELLFDTRVEEIIPLKNGKPLAVTNAGIKAEKRSREALCASDAEQEKPSSRPASLRSSQKRQEQDCPDQFLLRTNRGEICATKLIAAPGRAGAEWFSAQCAKLGLPMANNQVDLGVRVELPALVFKDITDAMYEAKLKYQTRQYRDIVRTFCMNPYGYVVAENTDGIITVNGHSFEDPQRRSENTNFALLVSNRFTEPFNEPYRYGKHIASLSNMLGGGVIMQRLGDLLDGRRTTAHRMLKSFVRPTLQATPGDLSLVLPKRHIDNIIEMLQVLDKLAPGTANADTLLYGVEVKFYSARLSLDANFETELPGFYAIGDGAGITRGLSQAGASGLKAGTAVLSELP